MNDLKGKLTDVIARAKTRDAALAGVYRLFIPEWDETAIIREWPSCGPALYEFLCERFEEFDREHEIEPDGLRQRVGFLKNVEMDDWSVSFAGCSLPEKGVRRLPAPSCSR